MLPSTIKHPCYCDGNMFCKQWCWSRTVGPAPSSIARVSAEMCNWAETNLEWYLKTHSVSENIIITRKALTSRDRCISVLGSGILLMLWECSSTLCIHAACVTVDVNHTPTQMPLFPQADKQPFSQHRKSVENLSKRLCLISLISFLFSSGSRPKAQPLRGATPFDQHWSQGFSKSFLWSSYFFQWEMFYVAQSEMFFPLDSRYTLLLLPRERKS